MEMSGFSSSEAKLGLLEGALPEAGRNHLQLRREQALRGGPPVTFEEMWAWVRRTWGAEDGQQAILADLKALKPETSGKLTAEAWLAYTTAFQLHLSRLPEKPSDSELADWAIDKLPADLVGSVKKEEYCRKNLRPILRLTGALGVDMGELQALFQATAGGPVTIRVAESCFEVETRSQEAAEALLFRTGQRLATGQTLSFALKEQRMSLEEVFLRVGAELRIREHCAPKKSSPEGSAAVAAVSASLLCSEARGPVQGGPQALLVEARACGYGSCGNLKIGFMCCGRCSASSEHYYFIFDGSAATFCIYLFSIAGYWLFWPTRSAAQLKIPRSRLSPPCI